MSAEKERKAKGTESRGRVACGPSPPPQRASYPPLQHQTSASNTLTKEPPQQHNYRKRNYNDTSPTTTPQQKTQSDDRKRKYNSMGEGGEVTAEVMEAYYRSKGRSDDPMANFEGGV